MRVVAWFGFAGGDGASAVNRTSLTAPRSVQVKPGSVSRCVLLLWAGAAGAGLASQVATAASFPRELVDLLKSTNT